ncbi:MAG: M15 family metallopeptidase [Pseudomonadales bacterium]
MMEVNWEAWVGQSRDALVQVDEQSALLLHNEVLPHWQDLVVRAATAGFDLQIASAWRGFDRQLAIWNGKASGQRPVLDAQSQPLDIACLSEDELLFAMLRWSAIPGCSRHHWGTDLDVYDAAAVPADYRVQLTPDECVGTGPFAKFHCWLDEQLQEPNAVFYRPYHTDCGGIAPERWHLSCKPIADRYEHLLDEKKLLDWLMAQDIVLKERIRVHWREIFQRFVQIP